VSRASQPSLPWVGVLGWSLAPAAWEPLPALLGPAPAWPSPSFAAARTPDDWPRLLADALPPTPVWLLGWSLGGMVALELAVTQPERVAGLVLLATPPALVACVAYPGWPAATLRRMAIRLDQDPAGTLRDFLAFFQPPAAPPTPLATLAQHAWGGALPDPTHWPAPALAAGLRYLAERHLWDHLPALCVPSLWLFGADDTLCRPALADAVRAALPASPAGRHTVLTLPGAGHAPHWDQPAAVVAALRDRGLPTHG